MNTSGHNSRASTLRESARFILACDKEVADVNDRKKEFFAELRAELPDEDIKALKDAIKIHRKRLKDRDGTEAHDTRVWDVLNIIEGAELPKAEETAPRPRKTALAGIVEETAPTRATREALNNVWSAVDCIAIIQPPHDPETGELTDPPCEERGGLTGPDMVSDHAASGPVTELNPAATLLAGASVDPAISLATSGGLEPLREPSPEPIDPDIGAGDPPAFMDRRSKVA